MRTNDIKVSLPHQTLFEKFKNYAFININI